MRLRKKKWTEAELMDNKRIIPEPAAWKGRWAEYFGLNRIALEIGAGKGGFTVETAMRNPEIGMIALERQPIILAQAARLAREKWPEGKSPAFVCADADELADFFAEGELARIYLNFSDPWPGRKKWRKRRLTHRGYLAAYALLLDETGEIHFKTDNRELFEFSLEEFSAMGWTLHSVSLDLHNSDFQDNVMTEYERKFSAKGQPIYRLEAKKPQ